MIEPNRSVRGVAHPARHATNAAQASRFIQATYDVSIDCASVSPPPVADINLLWQLGIMTDDFAALIPELPTWNNGAGVEPQAWIECVGNYELATGYSLIFWPNFVRFEAYVLREGFSVEALRGFEEMTKGNRVAVEAVMNHIHIADIHCNVEATEAQLRYLGRVLKNIWEVKLGRDFPDLRFQVEFNDERNVVLDEYELTFWQAH